MSALVAPATPLVGGTTPPLWAHQDCLTCGQSFTYRQRPNAKKKSDRQRQYCSRQCWLKKHNNPERNAAVSRATTEQRAAVLRARGDASGQWYRKVDGRHEHRTVVEQILGRPLRSDEIVHHRDEDKRSNNPCNLTLTTRSEHARHHNKSIISWHTHCHGCGQQITLKVYQRRLVRRGRQCFWCKPTCGGSRRYASYA